MASINSGLDHSDRMLVERFRTAFNRIEWHLCHELNKPDETDFVQLLIKYGEKNPVWYSRDGRRMRIYASVRNALVHTQQKQDEYLAIPVLRIVEDIERIAKELDEPDKVFPKFKRDVAALKTSDTLVGTLTLIQKNSFSQFPVYDESDNFAGLLTENGITRWLSNQVVNDDELVSFKETTVAMVMSSEEKRQNYDFVSRNTTVLDVVGRFSREPLLEAVLITHGGKKVETLLGIVTRWDVQDYLR